MPLVLSALFLVVYIISPADVFPSLAPLRIGLLLNVICFISLIWLMTAHPVANWPLQHSLLLLFWIIIVASRLFQSRFGAALQAFAVFMPCVLIYYLLAHAVRTKFDQRTIFATLISICTLLSILSILQYWNGDPESPWLYSQGFEELNDFGERDFIYRARALGTLNDPNAFAQLLISVLPFWWFIYQSSRRPMRILVLTLVSLVLYTCFITHSRGGLVGLVVLGFFALKERFGAFWSSIVAACLFIILVLLGFTGGRSVSLSGGENRIQIWADGMGMFRSSPMFGIGFGLFTEQSLWAAHNAFIECFSELGIVGYFVWISLLVTTVHQLIVVEEVSDSGLIESWYGLVARSVKWSLLTYLSMCMFLARAYSIPLYILLGVAVSVYLSACSINSDVALRFSRCRWVTHSAFISVGSIFALYVVIRLS